MNSIRRNKNKKNNWRISLHICIFRRAAAGLNGVEFDGGKLHAESLEKQRRGPRNRGQYPAMPGGGGPGRQTDFPLRLLVQSDMVGAIIGRQGSTIRQITQQSRARVDVHRKDNVGSLEKAITIYGNPENCTNACKRILEVMQQESVNTNKGWASVFFEFTFCALFKHSIFLAWTFFRQIILLAFVSFARYFVPLQKWNCVENPCAQ